jgi:hypothetical protein
MLESLYLTLRCIQLESIKIIENLKISELEETEMVLINSFRQSMQESQLLDTSIE